jgi:hypothetical protein
MEGHIVSNLRPGIAVMGAEFITKYKRIQNNSKTKRILL